VTTKQIIGVTFALAAMMMSGCSAPAPQPIVFGEDACHYCNMTIMERGFACELVTTKGKVYKYDAIECLAAYRHAGSIAAEDVHSQWVSDYNNAGVILNADSAMFIYSKQIRSPMAGGLCAVADYDVAIRVRDSSRGRIVTWTEVCEIVGNAWNVKPAAHQEG
jgi:copper chaperone NosL